MVSTVCSMVSSRVLGFLRYVLWYVLGFCEKYEVTNRSIVQKMSKLLSPKIMRPLCV